MFRASSLVLAFLFSTPCVEAQPSAFTKLISTPDFTISVNTDSFKLIGDSSNPLIGLEIQLLADQAFTHPESKYAVKYFINKIVVDCPNDKLQVTSSKAFSENDSLLFGAPPIDALMNPHNDQAPVTLIIELICKPLDLFKKNKSQIRSRGVVA